MKLLIKRLFPILLAAVLAVAPVASALASSPVDRAAQGVVRIATLYEKDGQLTSVSTGSGFAVGRAGEAPQYFVTNWHVVENEPYLGRVARIYILLQDNALTLEFQGNTNNLVNADADPTRTARCEIVYPHKADQAKYSGYPDFAILKTDQPLAQYKPLTLRRNDVISKNTDVYALGFPGFNDEATRVKPTSDGRLILNELGASIAYCGSTRGVADARFEWPDVNYTSVIRHSAQISHGNSGGPLVLANGEVIGINTYGTQDTESLATNGYAVDINYVMDTLDADRIPYTSAGGLNVTLIVVIAAGIVVLLALLVLLWLQRKRNRSFFKRGKAQDKTAPAAGTTPAPAAPSDSGFRFQGTSGAFANKRFSLNGEVSIGRDKKRNDLAYPPDTKGVSSQHCLLTQRGEHVYLRDLKSSFGTFVNGRKLQPMVETELSPGDTFSVGTDKETFKLIKKDAAR